MTQKIDIPLLFQAVAAKVKTGFSTRTEDPFKVFFDWGHYDAVNKNLYSKSKAVHDKTRYPLIWMVTPFDERSNPKQDYYCELSGLDFLFLMGTIGTDSMEKTTGKAFQPRLWPVVDAFKEAIADSGYFQVLSADAIPYDYQKDWYFKSVGEGKGNLFNDYIDAVQLKNVRLRVNEWIGDRVKIFS